MGSRPAGGLFRLALAFAVFCFTLKLQMVFHGGIRSALFCPFHKSAHVQLNPQEAGTEKVPLPLRAGAQPWEQRSLAQAAQRDSQIPTVPGNWNSIPETIGKHN